MFKLKTGPEVWKMTNDFFSRSESEAALPLVPVSLSVGSKKKKGKERRAGSFTSTWENLAATRAGSIISSMDLEVSIDTDSVRSNKS